MTSPTTDAKKIRNEWADLSIKLDKKASFISRQREIVGDALIQANILVQFPDSQPVRDKMVQLKHSLLATKEEDSIPFPSVVPTQIEYKQKISVTKSIQYAEESIKFHQDVLAKLKQIEALGEEPTEEARAFLREIEELGQTRRRHINTFVANTGHKSS